MRDQDALLETSHAARSTLDMLLRDLRLGGACLPVTGTFVTLEGVDAGTKDQLVTRTGLTRSDLSCVRGATTAAATAFSTTIAADTVDGFAAQTRVYLRHPNGSGAFFTVTSVDTAAKTLGLTPALDIDYPVTTGVYGIDERRYAIDDAVTPPVLTVQIGDESPMPFAKGIQAINIQYQLKRNCPPCDVVDLPASNAEWAIVEQLLLTLTARSTRPSEAGTYYERSLTVRVKPRNLLPR